METKVCTKCGKELPATEEYFYGGIDKRKNKFRFFAACKDCRKAQAKEYRDRNREKAIEYAKEYYKENKDKMLEVNKIYYEKNKDKISEQNKIYSEKNKEKIKAYRSKWGEENKEKLRKKRKENIEYHRAYKRQWYKENKEKDRANGQRRRTRLRKLPNTLTIDEWESVKYKFNNSCAYCGITEEEHFRKFGERLHQDHFIPLYKGGGYTIGNIVPSCRPCNSSKKNHYFSDWYKEYEHYSKDRERFIKNYLLEVRNA